MLCSLEGCAVREEGRRQSGGSDPGEGGTMVAGARLLAVGKGGGVGF